MSSQRSMQDLSASSHADAQEKRVWQFAEFRLDAGQRQLFCDGEPVALEPKPFDFLCLLLSRAGQLVSKDELIEQIWDGRVVTESVITRCAAKVRKALGSAADQLVTVHGYGYRFEGEVQYITPAAVARGPGSEAPAPAPVSDSPAPTARDAPSARPRFRWHWVAAACGLLLVVGAVLLAGWETPQAAHYENPSIAVLPFANLSPDTESTDYLAGGVHENLLTQLSRVQGLKVISRTSVARYADTTESIPVIGQRLGVDFVLEGSVQAVGKRLRVNAQLIEVSTDHHHWADAIDGDLADVFEIQSRIAVQVAETVGLKLASSPAEAQGQVSAQAMEAYLRAREQFTANPFERESLFRVQAALDRALSERDGFAEAFALRSRVHTYNYWFGYDFSERRLEQARRDWQQAMELEPELAEAYIAQGQFLSAGFRDYTGALQSYERAAELQPGNAEIQLLKASAYRRMGDLDRYLQLITAALDSDPENQQMLQDLASMYRLMGRRNEARELLLRAQKLSPDDVMITMQLALLEYEIRGDLSPLERALAAHAGEAGPGHMLDYFRYQLAYWQRDYVGALSQLQEYARHASPAYSGAAQSLPTTGALGEMRILTGQREEGLRLIRANKSELEAQLELRPNDPVTLAALAKNHAWLGEVAASLSVGRRAVELAASAGDPLQRADVCLTAVTAWALLPDLEPAMALLEACMSQSIGPPPGVLAAHPAFDPLRAHSRFHEIVGSLPDVPAQAKLRQ